MSPGGEWIRVDYFRNDRSARTVGLILDVEGVVADHFVGLRPDGSLDGRSIRWCRTWQTYLAAIDYVRWLVHEEMASERLERLVQEPRGNFFIAPGGNLKLDGARVMLDDLWRSQVGNRLGHGSCGQRGTRPERLLEKAGLLCLTEQEEKLRALVC